MNLNIFDDESKKNLFRKSSIESFIEGGKATPSDYFNPIKSLNPTFSLFPSARESSGPQLRNLEDQLNIIRKGIEEINLTRFIVEEFKYIGSGQYPENYIPDFIKKVQSYNFKNPALVFETVDRAVRPKSYHPVDNPLIPYTKKELDDFKKLLKGVEIFTITDPNLPPEDQHGAKTKRGMHEKGKLGGRPKKEKQRSTKDFKQEWVEVAFQMHLEWKSVIQITEEIRKRSGCQVAESTIFRWIKRERERLQVE